MRTGYFITARLKSTRLKRKILLNIDKETVLDKVIKRCKATIGVDTVVLCTSIDEEDEELEVFAKKYGIGFFRGSECDVLKRLLNAAKEFNIDRFLSITADNPFHSIVAAQNILEFDNTHSVDFVFTQNLPIGVSPYFIRTDALDVAVFMKKDSDTEIWGPFVNQPDFFKIGYVNFTNILLPAGLRITCDYEADFNFIKTLYAHTQTLLPDISELTNLYFTHPEFFTINQGIVQRMPDQEILRKIDIVFKLNVEKGQRYAFNKNIVLVPGKILENRTI
jgi:spore coat polysaccharide biosynthesis protein SpsF